MLATFMRLLLLLLLCRQSVLARPEKLQHKREGAFTSWIAKRQEPEPASTNGTATGLVTVDVGYEVYQGYRNITTGLTTFHGIRFAAPPTGDLRWQPPQEPAQNRSNVIQAFNFGPRCPQAGNAPYTYEPCPGLASGDTLPPECANSEAFHQSIQGDEDCLFLNLYAPKDSKDLPVLVWIHGGGYGEGDGRQDLAPIINANNNSFIGVSIQYRLGAFGFLSSDELYRFASPNAGILDQHLALQWVQKYISLFGGDPNRVTISGESAGGGSVMLQDMAYSGSQGTKLFQNSISSSPYLPMQYPYYGFVPSQSYYSFGEAVGCYNGYPYGNSFQTVFECLAGKDTLVLQQASAMVSASGLFGTWAFLPVTDGVFIADLPSKQLREGKVNGLRHMTGNNANDGVNFVQRNINTESDFENFVRKTFPLFNDSLVQQVIGAYPSSDAPVDPDAPLFATLGDSIATALNQSTFGTGQQQRAYNLYAETTFACSSYWLASAYSSDSSAFSKRSDYNESSLVAYKYQFSVPGAQHAEDVNGYFGPRPEELSPDFEQAFRSIWGNFVVHNNPSLSNLIANGVSTGNASANNPAADWPVWGMGGTYRMIDLNETGPSVQSVYNQTVGVEIEYQRAEGVSSNGTTSRTAFRNVDATTWEGGRGERCAFWRQVGESVPE